MQMYLALNKIENYLRHEMPLYLQSMVKEGRTNFSFDQLLFKEKLDDFETHAIVELPLGEFEKILQFKNILIKIYNGYIDQINKAINNEISLDELNSYVNKELKKFSFEEFKQYIRLNVSQNERNSFSFNDETLKLLKQINQDTQSLSVDTKIIINQVEALQKELGQFSFLIKNFTVNQSIATEQILNNLNLIDEKILTLDWNQILFQNYLNELKEKLEKSNLTDEEKKVVKTEINRSDIAIKHKLKFIVPLGFFIKYEGEVELTNKQVLPRNWKEWKKLFLKD